MKIILIGMGKMGRMVKELALSSGHTIIAEIDMDNTGDLTDDLFKKGDVAIEFSVPGAAYENINRCLDARIPVVSGTTGWLRELPAVIDHVKEVNGTLLYATNFSIGMNILFQLNKKLAGVMDKTGGWVPEIEEIHHLHKKDIPSGSAITLAEGIISECRAFDRWLSGRNGQEGAIDIRSVREGEIPGTHLVKWISDVDELTLSHKAYSREGFAAGAIFAAERIIGRKGVITMGEILGF